MEEAPVDRAVGEGVPDEARCAECGTALQGDYCHSCGQRRLGPEDRRLPRLLGEAFSTLTDLDGRWLRSFWLLTVDTGALSRAYLEGRRQRYLKPISLFLLVNLAFFLSTPVSDLDLPLVDHFYQPVYGEWALAHTQEVIAAAGMTGEEYTVRFDAQSSQVSKSMVIMHVPVIALFLLAGAGFRRWYYAEHLVVSLHVFGFLLLAAQLVALVSLGLSWLVGLVAAGPLPSAVPRMVGLMVLATFVMFGRGVARAYAASWQRTVPLVLASLIGLVAASFLYRFTQFVIVTRLVSTS